MATKPNTFTIWSSTERNFSKSKQNAREDKRKEETGDLKDASQV